MRVSKFTKMAVLMMAAKSASNIAEMAPAGGGKVHADVKGTTGGALAVIYIRDAERKANDEIKATETMKSRLMKLEGLTREDHLAFRAGLEERVDLIRDAAKSAGMSMAEYKEFDPKSNSIHATLSLWQGLSKSLEVGFKPNYNDTWGAMTVAATMARNAIGAAGAPGTEDKPQLAAPSTRKGQRGRVAKSNYDKAVAMLETFPSQDLEMVAAWLTKRLAHLAGAKVGDKQGVIIKAHVNGDLAPSTEAAIEQIIVRNRKAKAKPVSEKAGVEPKSEPAMAKGSSRK